MDKDIKPVSSETQPLGRSTPVSSERRPTDDGGVVEYPPVKTELRHGHVAR